MERTHAAAGEKCEEEGAADRSCYGLSTTPVPHPPAWHGVRGKEVEESGMEE